MKEGKGLLLVHWFLSINLLCHLFWFATPLPECTNTTAQAFGVLLVMMELPSPSSEDSGHIYQFRGYFGAFWEWFDPCRCLHLPFLFISGLVGFRSGSGRLNQPFLEWPPFFFSCLPGGEGRGWGFLSSSEDFTGLRLVQFLCFPRYRPASSSWPKGPHPRHSPLGGGIGNCFVSLYNTIELFFSCGYPFLL